MWVGVVENGWLRRTIIVHDCWGREEWLTGVIEEEDCNNRVEECTARQLGSRYACKVKQLLIS